MSSYCTLQGARRQLEVQNITLNQDQDAALFFYMLTGASAIDDWTGNWFDERLLTLGFNGNVGKYNPILMLNELPLQVVDSLTNGNGDVIASPNYTLLPTVTYPKTRLRLARGYYWRGPNDPANSSSNGSCCANNPQMDVAYAEDAIQITGRWAYHRNYPRAWRSITQVVGSGGIDESSTSLPLSVKPGISFDVGNILRVTTGADTEQMLVTGPIEGSTPNGFTSLVITVERGYNGTTAIAHNAGDAIAVWMPEPVIVNVAELIAAAFYKGRDNPSGDDQVVAEIGRMIIAKDLPTKAKSLLVPFRSWRRGKP